MDAPERIWVDIREETLRNFGVPFVARGFLAAPPRTEYVRADALAAKDAEIERLRQRDAEAATHVETVICLRTDFTGDPPYVGWKGLGLALTEALNERDRLRARIAEMEEALHPFSEIAGEMFARNWELGRVVVALDNPDGSNRVLFDDFLRARKALEG